jgi:hypothetical protein
MMIATILIKGDKKIWHIHVVALAMLLLKQQ